LRLQADHEQVTTWRTSENTPLAKVAELLYCDIGE
jgi:hypothetical protein